MMREPFIIQYGLLPENNMKIKKAIATFFRGRMCDAEWEEFCATVAAMGVAALIVLIGIALATGVWLPLSWRN